MTRSIAISLRCLLTAAMLIPALVSLTPGPAVADDAAFDAVWSTTDQAVLDGTAGYSWFWGPQSLTQTYEIYADSPNTQREVRYYDKSRMEINHPEGDRNNIYYVTNGLLTVELVSGQLKYGDPENYVEQRTPAIIPVAGDPDRNPGTPTYNVFGAYATTENGLNWSDDHTGGAVTAFLSGAGALSTTDSGGVTLAHFDDTTHHNVAHVFWAWMNESANGFRPAQGVDWLYVLGHPISEPYWISSTVGGTPRDVLVQLFERRVLTYTPDNPLAYQIEFGNIGQHYFRWRYGVAATAQIPSHYTVAFSTAIGLDAGIMSIDFDHPGTPVNLTTANDGPDGAPTYAPDGNHIAFYNGAGPGATLEVMDADGSAYRPVASGPVTFQGWSYDGTYLAYYSGDDSRIHVYDVEADFDQPIEGGYVSAAWSPDSHELLLGTEHNATLSTYQLNTGDTNEVAHTVGLVTLFDYYWLKGNRLVAIVHNLDTGVFCVQGETLGNDSLEILAHCSDTTTLSQLTVSADQTRVAYVRGQESSDDQSVTVQNVTGPAFVEDMTPLVEGSAKLIITGLDWSFHPTDIIAAARRGPPSVLYAVNTGYGSQRRLTDPSLIAAVLPSISPGR